MERLSGKGRDGRQMHRQRALTNAVSTHDRRPSSSRSRSPPRLIGGPAGVAAHPMRSRPVELIDITRDQNEFPSWPSGIENWPTYPRQQTISACLVQIPFYTPEQLPCPTFSDMLRLLEWRSTGNRLQLRMTNGTVVEVATMERTRRSESSSAALVATLEHT